MKFEGLKLDNPTGVVKEGTWSWAVNTLLGKGFDYLTNEKCPTILYDQRGNGENIIAILSTPTETILFINKVAGNTTTVIGAKLVRINEYGTFTIFETSYITFFNKVIESIYLYNSKNELIIVFTDNVIPAIVINCGIATSPTTYSFTSISDIESKYLFPYYKQTNIKLTSVDTGGKLNSGTYFATLCYVIDDDINTGFGPITNPIMVVKDTSSTPYDYFIGNANNDAAFKSITIVASDLDNRYKQFRIAIIKDNLAYITKAITITKPLLSYIIKDYTVSTPNSMTYSGGRVGYPNTYKIGTRLQNSVPGKIIKFKIITPTGTGSVGTSNHKVEVLINGVLKSTLVLDSLGSVANGPWTTFTFPTPIDVTLANSTIDLLVSTTGTQLQQYEAPLTDIITTDNVLSFVATVWWTSANAIINMATGVNNYTDIVFETTTLDPISVKINIPVTINNLTDLETIALSEITTHSSSYSTIKTLAYCNNRLRIANLTTVKRRSITDMYEKLMKYVTIDWVYQDSISVNDTENSYKDPIVIFNKRGFRRDEVYAFYLSLKLNTGEEYGTYHIPGRPIADYANIGTYSLIPYYRMRADISVDTGDVFPDVFKMFQMYDLIIPIDPALPANQQYRGYMSYWENQNEVYPSEFGATLAGNPVRHHKFPSSKYLESHTASSYENIIFTTNSISDSFVASDSYFKPLVPITEYFSYDVGTSPTLGCGFFATLLPSNINGDSSKVGVKQFELKYATLINTDGLSTEPTHKYDTINASGTRYVSKILHNLSLVGTITVINYYSISVNIYDSLGNKDTVNSFRLHNSPGITGNTTVIPINVNINLEIGSYIDFVIYCQTPDFSTVYDRTAILTNLSYTQTLLQKSIKVLGIQPTINWDAIKANDLAFYNEISQYCTAYEIKYAERTTNDSLIVDQSVVIKDYQSKPFGTVGELTIPQIDTGYNYLRFYGIDSLINKLNIKPTHIKLVNDNPTIPAISNIAGGKTSLLTVDNYISIPGTTDNPFKKIKTIQYLPAYNSATIPSNESKEDCYSIELYDSSYDLFNYGLCNLIIIRDDCYLDFTNKTLVSTGRTIDINTNVDKLYGGDTFINYSSVIANLKINTYTTLLGITKYFSLLANLKFISEATSNIGFRYQGSNIWEKYFPFTDVTVDLRGLWIAQGSSIYPSPQYVSKGNIFRITEAVDGTHSSVFVDGDYVKALISSANVKVLTGTDPILCYEISSVPIYGSLESTGYCNYILYDNIFNSVNKFIQSVIANIKDTYIENNFPTRIHSSVSQSNVTSSLYFRKFLTLDHYDMPNQKGNIIKLNANNRILFIQHEHTLFRAFVLDKLVNENVDSYLKSGEIFDRLPEELFFDNNSYINCEFSSASKLTPFGYVCIDTIEGYIYMVTDKVESLTKTGIENWFRDRVRKMSFTSDMNNMGYRYIPSIGYDKDNDRLLFNISSSFCISYHVENKSFISFHLNKGGINDYSWNSNGLYSITNGYLYHLGDTFNYNVAYFGNNANKEMYVDFVFNAESKFILHNVNWITTMLEGNIKHADETISAILIFNKEQCSNRIALVSYAGAIPTTLLETFSDNGQLNKTGNLKYSFGKFKFTEFSDDLATPETVFLDEDNNLIQNNTIFPPTKNWYDKTPFAGTSIVVRVYFTNDNRNRQLLIHDINLNSTEYR